MHHWYGVFIKCINIIEYSMQQVLLHHQNVSYQGFGYSLVHSSHKHISVHTLYHFTPLQSHSSVHIFTLHCTYVHYLSHAGLLQIMFTVHTLLLVHIYTLQYTTVCTYLVIGLVAEITQNKRKTQTSTSSFRFRK